MRKLKNISRLDYRRGHGWWVRFEYRDHHISKMFSDSLWGGRMKARAAAIKYRDKVQLALPERHHGPDMLPGPGRIWKERRCYLSLSGTRKYFNAWTAWIMLTPRHPASTNFSIDKWGTRKAKKMTQLWLDKKRGEQKRNYVKMLGVILP
jgi:hypothetical protein